MIFSAFLSFLGGSAFRMIWGEVAAWLNKKTDHQYEMDRLALQQKMDDATHANTMEALRVQNELQLQVVHANMDAAVNVEEAKSFTAAMVEAFKPTGITLVDAWNSSIRPAAATVVLVLWLMKLFVAHGKMDPWDQELASAILGFFFADRSLGQRGK